MFKLKIGDGSPIYRASLGKYVHRILQLCLVIFCVASPNVKVKISLKSEHLFDRFPNSSSSSKLPFSKFIIPDGSLYCNL